MDDDPIFQGSTEMVSTTEGAGIFLIDFDSGNFDKNLKPLTYPGFFQTC
jgi:hypothetical protein